MPKAIFYAKLESVRHLLQKRKRSENLVQAQENLKSLRNPKNLKNPGNQRKNRKRRSRKFAKKSRRK